MIRNCPFLPKPVLLTNKIHIMPLIEKQASEKINLEENAKTPVVA